MTLGWHEMRFRGFPQCPECYGKYMVETRVSETVLEFRPCVTCDRRRDLEEVSEADIAQMRANEDSRQDSKTPSADGKYTY